MSTSSVLCSWLLVGSMFRVHLLETWAILVSAAELFGLNDLWTPASSTFQYFQDALLQKYTFFTYMFHISLFVLEAPIAED